MDRGAEPFARAILRSALLVLLKEGDGHGYGLYGRLRDDVGLPLSDVGAVYKALGSLEEDKLVAARWDTRVRRGPPRKVYRLTARGERQLAGLQSELETQRQVISTLLTRSANGSGQP